MGGSTSRPLQCVHGCWSSKSPNGDDDIDKKKKGSKSSRNQLKKLKLSDRELCACHWEEIPTPSVCEHRDTPVEGPPSQEKLIQIINCFPYPTPRTSPQPEQVIICEHMNNVDSENKSFGDAFEKLVQVSVETMAITALPIDVWLKERLKKWVQLSGHEGSIVPATTCTLYKKQTGNCMEARAYENITKDSVLNGFTPRYFKQLQKNDECFIEIEDLLQQFADPSKTSIMDIKIGTRTFLESEVSNTKRRKDLYEKMTAIDPDEPTPEERACGEITKLRYMQFRERESSSAELGFRIEAAKMPGGSLQKNFKKVRTYEDVTRALIDFFGTDRERIRSRLLARLKAMRSAIERSHFFATHEVVGSSLLIVHDHEKVNCWMIDFAKSSPVDSTRRLDHRTPWVPGNSEDGYLLGVDNLIKILEGMPPVEVTIVEELS
uniref:Kinase n=1 Tax=Haemonchus contortus TaxID=6289 RepID=A0A7I4XV02_HAECO